MLLSKINPDNINEETVEKVLFDIPNDDLKMGDCIFVFGSKTHMIERVSKAVDLYRKKRAPKIMFSGGLGRDGEIPEAILMSQYAQSLGIPEQDIITESDSNNTTENVLCSLVVLERTLLLQNINRLLIVTNCAHIKRCMLTLSRYMPRWIEYSYCYNDNDLTNQINWKNDKATKERMFREVRNMIFYANEKYIDDIDIKI